MAPAVSHQAIDLPLELGQLTASDGTAGDTIVVGSLGGMYGDSPVPGSVYIFALGLHYRPHFPLVAR